MTDLITAASMRALEIAAISAGKVTGLELMERAGRAVVDAIFAESPALQAAPLHAVVLCGPGNNGGDGFVVARLLADWGWRVSVYLAGDIHRLPPDARSTCERWRGIGAVNAWDADRILAETADLYIDAVFGAGLNRAPAAAITDVFARLAASGKARGKMVAVDAPTGLCMDSGRDLCAPAEASRAFLTVTFHAPRPGHYLAEGPDFCGKLVVCDIGLARGAEPDPALRLAAPDCASLGKDEGGHKYQHGHALVVSGPAGRTGAARLAARAALRVGAGLVTIACDDEALAEHAARLDAIMLRSADAGVLDQMLTDRRISAVCIGPALGTDGPAAELLAAALRFHLPPGSLVIDPASKEDLDAWMRRHGHLTASVLDADALTLLAGSPDLMALLHKGCVLTPHAGEFARLFPDLAQRLAMPPVAGPAFSKVDATRAAARRAGCVVLFKGPDTVIADPAGNCVVSAARYDRAAPWLATAGSGDVLAGLVAGLLARGLTPMRAAETAAWLHVECARRFGPGLIAEDLPEILPATLCALGIGPQPLARSSIP